LVYKDKGSLQERTKEEFEDITEDDNIITQIFERAKSSMGNDLSEVDEKNIREFADYILQHYDYKRNLQTYLKEQMSNVAPNLTTILGESVAARLLTHSGGLNNLAKLPASTIQILGAEKALFRALKTKTRTPKYGLLYNSSYITKAESTSKGQISRILANKCALASKLDNFLIKVR